MFVDESTVRRPTRDRMSRLPAASAFTGSTTRRSARERDHADLLVLADGIEDGRPT